MNSEDKIPNFNEYIICQEIKDIYIQGIREAHKLSTVVTPVPLPSLAYC